MAAPPTRQVARDKINTCPLVWSPGLCSRPETGTRVPKRATNRPSGSQRCAKAGLLVLRGASAHAISRVGAVVAHAAP